MLAHGAACGMLAQRFVGGPLNNNTVAILTKVNELVERYGVSACDMVIALHDAPGGNTRLSVEVLPDDARHRGLDKAMRAMGLSPETTSLIGSDQEIYARLKEAVRLAPKAKSRQ